MKNFIFFAVLGLTLCAECPECTVKENFMGAERRVHGHDAVFL